MCSCGADLARWGTSSVGGDMVFGVGLGGGREVEFGFGSNFVVRAWIKLDWLRVLGIGSWVLDPG